MNEDQLVAILLTKEDVYRLYSICHDSFSYWHKHRHKAFENSNYFLSQSGCEAVLNANKEVSDKIEAIYFALNAREEEEEEKKVQEEQEDTTLNAVA